MENDNKIKGITEMDFLFFDALSVRVGDNWRGSDLTDFFKSFCEETQSYPIKERNGNGSYSHTIEFETEYGIIMASYGGSVENMGVLLETKGQGNSELLANFINNCVGSETWALTRADVTLDFDGGDEEFIRVKDELIHYSMAKNVKSFPSAGDWVTPFAGRTQYAGSKDSESRFRLYEKTYEQWKKGNKDYPANVLRLEWQYRPKRKKAHIKRLEPYHVLSFHKNAMGFFARLSGMAIAPTKVPKPAIKTAEERFYHMMKQYDAVIDQLVSEVGYAGLARMARKRFITNTMLRKRR